MKKLISILVCSCVLFTSTAFAQGPVRLIKDQTYIVQEDGWFFTDSQERMMRYRLIEGTYFEKEVVLLKSSIDLHKNLYKSQLEISTKYREAWLESDKQLTAVLKSHNRTKFLYLALGIVLTVGAGVAMAAGSGALR